MRTLFFKIRTKKMRQNYRSSLNFYLKQQKKSIIPYSFASNGSSSIVLKFAAAGWYYKIHGKI
jgi:hypothetical protein